MILKDKISLVTGAGQGIGKTIAEHLAREGSHVAVNDVDLKSARAVKNAIEGLGRQSIAVQADVSKMDEVEKMARVILKKFKRIDILVNNAGISYEYPITELTEEIWDKIMDINLKGTFLCCKVFVEQMISRKSGKIINISSMAGKFGGRWLTAYSASKSGVLGFTRSLARELAKYNINVNSVCPGIIRTQLWDGLKPMHARKLGIAEDKVDDYYLKQIPLGRLSTGDDIAKVVVFLASSNSDYMTGQSINVTGGQVMQ